MLYEIFNRKIIFFSQKKIILLYLVPNKSKRKNNVQVGNRSFYKRYVSIVPRHRVDYRYYVKFKFNDKSLDTYEK